MPRPGPFPLSLLVLPAAAVVCALAANALAGPQRRLAWTGAPGAALAPRDVPALPAPASLAGPAAPSPAPGQPAPTQAGPRQAAPAPTAPAQPAPGQAAPRPAAPAQEPDARRFQADPAAVTREIAGADAWEAWRLRVPFLDARRSADYAEGHVRGAWSAPVWEADLDARLTEFEAGANPGPRDPIVIYCSGGGCEDSHLLARKLIGLGYRNLLLYAGGWPDWHSQGRPASTGAAR